MTKTILMLTLAVLTDAASAQSQTLYDANGKIVGRSATDARQRQGHHPRVQDRQHDDDL